VFIARDAREYSGHRGLTAVRHLTTNHFAPTELGTSHKPTSYKHSIVPRFYQNV
jgi:hypothetical protein